MTEINHYVSVMTPNVNCLNFSIKRNRLPEWIKKGSSTMCSVQETYLILKIYLQIKVMWFKNIVLCSKYPEKSKNFYSNVTQIDIKLRLIRRDSGGHYILVKGIIQQEELTNINIHALNINTSCLIKQILLDTKDEINTNTVVIIGDLNILLHKCTNINKT